MILAGGLGTRLGALTADCPKPMLPVAGKPFLEWHLESLKRAGAKRVLLLISYLADQVKAHFGDGSRWGMEIDYSVEPSPLGTAGAIFYAWKQVDKEFLLLNGDSYLEVAYDQFVEAARARPACDAVMLACRHVENDPLPPNVKLAGTQVTGYQRTAKPADGFGYIDSGVGFFRKDRIAEEQGRWAQASAKLAPKLAMDEILRALVARGTLGAVETDRRFHDIGTPETLAAFERALTARK